MGDLIGCPTVDRVMEAIHGRSPEEFVRGDGALLPGGVVPIPEISSLLGIPVGTVAPLPPGRKIVAEDALDAARDSGVGGRPPEGTRIETLDLVTSVKKHPAVDDYLDRALLASGTGGGGGRTWGAKKGGGGGFFLWGGGAAARAYGMHERFVEEVAGER